MSYRAQPVEVVLRVLVQQYPKFHDGLSFVSIDSANVQKEWHLDDLDLRNVLEGWDTKTIPKAIERMLENYVTEVLPDGTDFILRVRFL